MTLGCRVGTCSQHFEIFDRKSIAGVLVWAQPRLQGICCHPFIKAWAELVKYCKRKRFCLDSRRLYRQLERQMCKQNCSCWQSIPQPKTVETLMATDVVSHSVGIQGSEGWPSLEFIQVVER